VVIKYQKIKKGGDKISKK